MLVCNLYSLMKFLLLRKTNITGFHYLTGLWHLMAGNFCNIVCDEGECQFVLFFLEYLPVLAAKWFVPKGNIYLLLKLM